MLLTFEGTVLTWVNGARRHGDPADVILHEHDQVVIAINGAVEVHPSFTFKWFDAGTSGT